MQGATEQQDASQQQQVPRLFTKNSTNGFGCLFGIEHFKQIFWGSINYRDGTWNLELGTLRRELEEQRKHIAQMEAEL